MTLPSRSTAVLVFFLACSTPAFARPALLDEADAPTLRVRIYNHAAVPQRILSKGKNVAAEILGDVGVHIIWMDCPLTEAERNLYPDCQKPFSALDLVLRLTPLASKMNLSGDAFGLAMIDEAGRGYMAYILYHRVSTLATDHNVDTGLLLGHIAAHEIGHLLLGANGHTPGGIMAAHWQGQNLKAAARGNLKFSASQAAKMRIEAVRRVNSSVASQPLRRLASDLY